MRYFNETEKRLAERYHHMELGTCKICEECHKRERLSLPIGCWCVGSDFNKTSKRILFVGKNARNNPGTIEDGFRNPFNIPVNLCGTKAGHTGAILVLSL